MRTVLLFALGLLCSGGPALAADTAPTTPTDAGEPGVQVNVVEDDRVRIEELRVRGQLQRVVVSTKGRAPDYEIVVPDGARDLSEGAGTTRGAAGKRVWNLLRF